MSIAKLVFFGALIGSALPTLALADVNLVLNGSFEDGLADWMTFGNTGFSGVTGVFSGVNPEDGSYQAYFGPVGDPGGIKQETSLVSDATVFDVSFYLYNFGGTPNSASVTLGSHTLLSLTNADAFGYTKFSSTDVPAGANPTLTFAFQNNPSYFLLDNVVVTAVTASTPEPAWYGVLAVGLGGLAVALRRRKSSLS